MTDVFDRLKSALADRYAIERELGSGGMATVYLAEDLKHERQVALKVMRPELSAILGGERFLREIRIAAKLNHPHILALYDSGEADGFLYYVMPHVEGESLRSKLTREKQLPLDEAITITQQVAAALDYAHQEGVIHRDIKPENILIQRGEALVADFGIALAVSTAAGTRLTDTGLSLGTPEYMSPEQATGEREITARSDVYSLGSVVYEMLVGEPPHTGNTVQAIIAKVVSVEPQPISRVRRTVPSNVDAAVQCALAKVPADRFGSGAEFTDALTDPAFTLATVAGAAAAALSAGPWRRIALAAIAVAAVLAVSTVWGWLRPGPEPANPVIRYALALPEEEELLDVFGTSVALSPDGSRLVYVGPGDQGTQLWIRQRDQLHGSPLPGTEAAWQPFFSPDGRRVAFVTEDRQLKVVSLTGEPPLTLVESDLDPVSGAWGVDGYVYFGSLPRGRLMRVSATGSGVPEPLPTLDATGERRVLVQGVFARYAASGHLVYVRYDGALLAAPFDQDKLVLTGPPVALLGEIAVRNGPDVALSQTGRLIYVPGTTGGSADVVWVDRNGTAEPLDPSWRGSFVGLALSPDETRLAVSIGQSNVAEQLWIKQLPRGPLSLLTFQGDLNRRPAWTRDGRAVTFVSDRGENRDLYVKRADGSAGAEVLLDDARPLDEGFYSPDGEWLVYRLGYGQSTGVRDLFAIRPGIDSVATPLVPTGFDEYSPALSPDGQWLAYVSDESGRREVYVQPFPNAGEAKWQVSTTGGNEPVWAHSGRELFYKSGSNELISAEVLPGTTFVVGEQRALFSTAAYQSENFHQAYDVTADDQRFVMVRVAITGEEGGLIVVENFFEELRAKVGRE
jgi:serine/threonine-protein kinase